MTVPYISRAGWGARSATIKTVPASKRTEFFVHYDGANRITRTGNAIPKAIEATHRGQGWATVGYNFVVDQAGNVYEGRGWNGVGAHCPNHNTTGIGVQVAIGGDQDPSDIALIRVRELYEEACQRAGRRLAKKGHRDGKATACPGDKLYAWVRAGMPASTGTPVAPPAAPAPAPAAPAPAPAPRLNDMGNSLRLDEDGDHGGKTQSRFEESLIRTGGNLALTGVIDIRQFGGLRHPVMHPTTEVAAQLRLNHLAVLHGKSFRSDGRPGLKADGDFKKLSTRALQWATGTRDDGDWGDESVKGLQRTLNAREL